MENNNVTPTPVTPQAPTPQPAPAPQPYVQKPIAPMGQMPVTGTQPTPVAAPYVQRPVAPAPQPPVSAAPVHTPAQPQPVQPMQPIQSQPAPTPVVVRPIQAPQTGQPVQAQPTPIVVKAVPAPAPQPQSEEVQEEETEQKEEEKKPAKLILNTQRILDDWKFEKGKVLIFLMKLMKVFVVLGAITLFIMGFIGLIGMNIAISFLKPIDFLTRNAATSQIMLIAATFLTIWVSFANKLTPYFKAFSIAKWLKKNEVDPKEVMKIFLQSRREKELTKYKKGRGEINAEKADLSQAALILLSEDNKKSYKVEMVWALLFWIFISALKIAFVYLLSGVIGNICLQISEIIEKTASFDFMKLVNFALDPIFLGCIGGWILMGIIKAIVIVCIAASRNRKQQKWVKTYMKEDMPSEEYYEE